MKLFSVLTSILPPSTLLIILTGHTAAAVRTWDGGSLTSNNWSTSVLGFNGFNWNPNGNPVAGDSLIFAGGNRTTNTNNFATNTSFNGISFANGASPFTLGGNPIVLPALGHITNDSSSLQTIGLSLNLNGTGDRTFNAASGDLAISGGVSGAGSLVKAGSNTLSLTGTNGYTGTTSVNAGTLNLTGSLATGSAVTVANAATLAGSGTVGGAATILTGGTLSPTGTTLTFSNNLTFGSGSVFTWDLAASGAGSTNQGTYDKVTVNGSLAGGGARFDLRGVDLSTTFWDTNKTWNNIFTVASGDTLATVFTQFGGVAPASGIVSGQGRFTFSGNSLNWTAVPEPTGALAGLLITAGAFRRRRNRR